MIGLDFETYGSRNLPAVGLDNYTADPDFQPLLAAVAFEDKATHVIDFSRDFDHALAELYGLVVLPALQGTEIAAHNAGFERAVLKALGYRLPADMFADSAVVARALGYGGSLEAAAPQMLGVPKLESGKELIKLFSIGDGPFDVSTATDNPAEWDLFKSYCQVDAELSLRIVREGLRTHGWLHEELETSALTLEMNDTGWPVDMHLLGVLEKRYAENVASLEAEVAKIDPDLNLFSHPQMLQWFKARGIRASSFDEKSVAKLLTQVTAKIASLPHDHPRQNGYHQALYILQSKQAMGGSSPKKLAKLRATVGSDGRLRDQYLHVGASATFRTTGRGVQMQNLPRLHGEGDPVDRAAGWTNDEIAHNLRQVFRAQHKDGMLIVGDFSSVESRGLAWQAGEQWKLDAYFEGADIYKELAARKFGKPVDSITKDERMFGKVGELSCGYGAGSGAVQSFAEGMGVKLTEAEAAELVRDWRDANPRTVDYWRNLEAVLNRVMALEVDQQFDAGNCTIEMRIVTAPESLRKQTDDKILTSLEYSVLLPGFTGVVHYLTRTIHGVHRDGRNVGYFRSTARKTGDLWVDKYVDPKTGQQRKYSLYGGKLAGLLTQSICREVFFDRLRTVELFTRQQSNVRVIGQFHDEIVLEWQPDPFPGKAGPAIPLYEAKGKLLGAMSMKSMSGFPMAAEVHAAPRYIK